MQVTVAPPRGLSTPRALKAKNKKTKELVGHEIGGVLTDLHQISHARSCIHCLWFPHTPMPSRPLKRFKNFNSFFVFSQLSFFGLSFRAHLGYGYTSRAGAIYTEITKLSSGDALLESSWGEKDGGKGTPGNRKQFQNYLVASLAGALLRSGEIKELSTGATTTKGFSKSRNMGPKWHLEVMASL